MPEIHIDVSDDNLGDEVGVSVDDAHTSDLSIQIGDFCIVVSHDQAEAVWKELNEWFREETDAEKEVVPIKQSRRRRVES